MTGPIVRAWESPTNEGTRRYEVGEQTTLWRGPCVVSGFEVSRIAWVDDGEMRLCVYDLDDELRVSLPSAAVAVEHDRPEEES